MPNRQTIEAFVALVEAGDYVGAIEQFYAPEASTRENTADPVVGREVLMAKERGVMAAYRNIEACRIGPSLIDGDTVAARWKFTFTGNDGSVRTLEEIAWQIWRDEKLIEERFFYDPRQMTGPKAQSEISEQRTS
jgi:aldehyde:ferredoxin oxidoreductase